MKMPPDRVVAETYLHVCNSGATFRVLDTEYGPEVEISIGAFGAIESTIKIKTTREGLEDLKRVFSIASQSQQKYSADYCHAANSTYRDPKMPCGAGPAAAGTDSVALSSEPS